jgi:hypothetical protein
MKPARRQARHVTIDPPPPPPGRAPLPARMSPRWPASAAARQAGSATHRDAEAKPVSEPATTPRPCRGYAGSESKARPVRARQRAKEPEVLPRFAQSPSPLRRVRSRSQQNPDAGRKEQAARGMVSSGEKWKTRSRARSGHVRGHGNAVTDSHTKPVDRPMVTE